MSARAPLRSGAQRFLQYDSSTATPFIRSQSVHLKSRTAISHSSQSLRKFHTSRDSLSFYCNSGATTASSSYPEHGSSFHIVHHTTLRHYSSEASNISDTSSQKPIICLYGWLGCKPQHLNKFEKMYHKLGYETIAFIPSMTSTISEKSAKRNAEQVLGMMEERVASRTRQHASPRDNRGDASNASPSPVSFVAHSFSGNGIYTFGRALELAQLRNVKLRYRGLIFDSTPPKIDVDRFVRGFVGGIKARSRSGAAQDLDPAFYQHWLLTPLAHFIFRLFLVFHGKHYQEFQENVLNQLPQRIPSLFIYSKRDILVPPQDVEAFIAEFQKRGASKIERLFFTDSGHIMHYKMHPEEYEKKVADFLHECNEEFEHKNQDEL